MANEVLQMVSRCVLRKLMAEAYQSSYAADLRSPLFLRSLSLALQQQLVVLHHCLQIERRAILGGV